MIVDGRAPGEVTEVDVEAPATGVVAVEEAVEVAAEAAPEAEEVIAVEEVEEKLSDILN